jgi:hypothetical protein
MKKIGVVGTRRRDTPSAYRVVEDKFFELYEEGDWIVSGGCSKGGDRFAEVIAKKHGIPILTIYPNYPRYKQGANNVRNGPVAENSDVVIACVMHPEDGIIKVLQRTKGGTEDMLKKHAKFKSNKYEVHLV